MDAGNLMGGHAVTSSLLSEKHPVLACIPSAVMTGFDLQKRKETYRALLGEKRQHLEGKLF